MSSDGRPAVGLHYCPSCSLCNLESLEGHAEQLCTWCVVRCACSWPAKRPWMLACRACSKSAQFIALAARGRFVISRGLSLACSASARPGVAPRLGSPCPSRGSAPPGRFLPGFMDVHGHKPRALHDVQSAFELILNLASWATEGEIKVRHLCAHWAVHAPGLQACQWHVEALQIPKWRTHGGS